MAKSKKYMDPIPNHFNSIQEAGEFWDEHSLADYWDQTKEVHFDVEIEEAPRYIVLEPILKTIFSLPNFLELQSLFFIPIS